MRSTFSVLVIGAGAYAAAFLSVGVGADAGLGQSRTTRDGVYTAEQAARGKAFFTKTCSKCHATAFVPDGPPMEGPPLGGDSFFNNWEDKSVFDLITNIRLGMPPDGSVNVSAAQAADAIAFLLEANTLPAGATELPSDAAARNVKILRPAGTPGR